MAKKPDKKAVDFFYKHAGWGYDPKKETAAQGRRRGAKLLALAEAEAEARGWEVEWLEEEERCESDGDPDGTDADYYWARLADASGAHLESLGCVGFQHGAHLSREPYARVIGAELAYEALRRMGWQTRFEFE